MAAISIRIREQNAQLNGLFAELRLLQEASKYPHKFALHCPLPQTPMFPIKSLLFCSAFFALLLSAQPVQGGAASPPGQPTTSAFEGLPSAEIRTLILDFCVIAASNEADTDGEKARIVNACQCYTNRVMRLMNEDDLEYLRRTGVFPDTMREEAFKAKERCGA
jgi:hypothetical protein